MVNNILLFMITGIILFGIIKGVDVYSAFVEGAKEGVQTTIRIFPYMVSLMVAITIFKSSGAINVLSKGLAPLLKPFGVPTEALPLIILKPFSGGASFGILADMISAYGADSYIGLVSSVMMGSSETIFYTVALYFGYVGIRKSRHTVICALLAHLAGIIGAIIAVNLVF